MDKLRCTTVYTHDIFIRTKKVMNFIQIFLVLIWTKKVYLKFWGKCKFSLHALNIWNGSQIFVSLLVLLGRNYLTLIKYYFYLFVRPSLEKFIWIYFNNEFYLIYHLRNLCVHIAKTFKRFPEKSTNLESLTCWSVKVWRQNAVL